MGTSWSGGPAGGSGGNLVSSVFGRIGAVIAALNDYAASLIDNDSAAPGATVKDALDALDASIISLDSDSTPLARGTNLTNADQTLATAQRYVMLDGLTTAVRTKTLTPPTAGRGFLIEVGTQGNNVVVQNGGAGGTAGLFSYTVVAGTRYALFFVSDGTDVSLAAAMPLGAEPV